MKKTSLVPFPISQLKQKDWSFSFKPRSFLSLAVMLFSKSNNFLWEYFHPIKFVFHDKNKRFPGWPNRCFGQNKNTDHKQCFCFQNLITYFFGYFDPDNIVLDNENKWFTGWPNRRYGLNKNTDHKHTDIHQSNCPWQLQTKTLQTWIIQTFSLLHRTPHPIYTAPFPSHDDAWHETTPRYRSKTTQTE